MGKKLRVLVACEYSGKVREAFRKLGHDAWSCDLLPADDGSPYHIQGDVLDHLNDGWDLMIAHPPCTYLANSGVQSMYKQPLRWKHLIEGAVFFRKLLEADIPLKAIENPIMHKYAKQIVGVSQTQVIQPWMFGEDASKATCLWLTGLPKLQPTNIIKKHRYANQSPSGANKYGPSPDRWKLRSTTFQGIADAMGQQWGSKRATQAVPLPFISRKENRTPHRCPVCGGNGKVSQGFYSQTSGNWWSTGGTEPCQSCEGTGIVWSTEIIEHTDTPVTDLVKNYPEVSGAVVKSAHLTEATQERKES